MDDPYRAPSFRSEHHARPADFSRAHGRLWVHRAPRDVLAGEIDLVARMGDPSKANDDYAPWRWRTRQVKFPSERIAQIPSASWARAERGAALAAP